MNGGINFSSVLGDYESIWYPASGYRDGTNGNLRNVNGNGFYWSVTPLDQLDEHNSEYYQFSVRTDGSVYILGYDESMHGYPVRCQKE